MNKDDATILRGCLSLVAMPFWLLFTVYLHLPFLIARRIWRWYRLPQHKRDAINANEQVAWDHNWEGVDALVRAELIAHGLPDTPANRAKLSSGKIRRRR
jgi:hypothetical protein